MNCGIGAMGPYNHANATIGRAYGLLSQNLQGGSVPGETYMGSIGNSYTYNNLTFAENEERSPWEPLHVQKGFKPTDQHGQHVLRLPLDHLQPRAARELLARARARHAARHRCHHARPCLLLDPITARQFIDRGGFDTKAKLIRWIHETAEDARPGRYWDLQLVQNYIYPRATYGEEPFAEQPQAPTTS